MFDDKIHQNEKDSYLNDLNNNLMISRLILDLDVRIGFEILKYLKSLLFLVAEDTSFFWGRFERTFEENWIEYN